MAFRPTHHRWATPPARHQPISFRISALMGPPSRFRRRKPTIRTEQVYFPYEASWERNMDDLILRAAMWQTEHWTDRSVFLKAAAVRDTTGACKSPSTECVRLHFSRSDSFEADRSRRSPSEGPFARSRCRKRARHCQPHVRAIKSKPRV